MRPLAIVIILTVFITIVDLYTFRGLQLMSPALLEGSRLFTILFWGISLIIFLAFLWAGIQFQKLRDPARFIEVMMVMGIFLMIYIPKLIFNLTQLLGDIVTLVSRLSGAEGGAGPVRYYILMAGAVVGILMFFAFGYGMVRGRTHVKVFKETISIQDLPDPFEGLKVVQLSDMHLAGFFNNKGHIKNVVQKINGLKPDLIFFTGDMVNTFAEEVDPFVDILDDLEAPLGKFAVLGNHDYGTYFQWESPEQEKANLDGLKSRIRAADFDLLLNENRNISLNGHSIEILGIENWGKPPFPQMGDLSEAMEGTRPENVKILLSHDPSYWDLKVMGRENIPLTLSGHTHGMQFGLEIGKFRWSPSKWIYKNWGGLYGENGQYLYVNRGLGFTGFPGRIGIRPEITLLTLTGN